MSPSRLHSAFTQDRVESDIAFNHLHATLAYTQLHRVTHCPRVSTAIPDGTKALGGTGATYMHALHALLALMSWTKTAMQLAFFSIPAYYQPCTSLLTESPFSDRTKSTY